MLGQILGVTLVLGLAQIKQSSSNLTKIASRTTNCLLSFYPSYIPQDYRDDLELAMEEERNEAHTLGGNKLLIQVAIQTDLWLIWDIALAHTIDRFAPSRRQNSE